MVLGADRRVIGILSERDIVHTFAEFGSDAPTKRLAREVATRGEADTAVSIMERMTANRVRHIPVVDRDRLVPAGKPAGSKHTIFPCTRVQ